MATIDTDNLKAMECDHVVVVPDWKMDRYFTEMLTWVAQPEIPGKATWSSGRMILKQGKPRWYRMRKDPFDSSELASVFGFTDANAAFEFKMRWG